MRRIVFVLLLLLYFQRPEAGHVILISIDGLNPDYYRLPAMDALRRTGMWADGVVGQYPSLTYPSHTSIVTGVRPATHGVVSNTVFDPPGGSRRWYQTAGTIKVPALWDLARAHGLKTAAIAWPVSIGAPVDFLIPEAYPPPAGVSTAQYTRQLSTPGLMDAAGLDFDPDDATARDEFFTQIAAHIIRVHKPNLLLLHLTATDAEQHAYGRDSAQSERAFAAADAQVAEIVKAAREAGIAGRTTFIVTGDHGFYDIHSVLQPNVILRTAGLLKTNEAGSITSWKAAAHASAIRLADPLDRDTARRVTDLFEELSGGEFKGVFRLVKRPELDSLGAYPDALFFIEPVEGFLPVETFGGNSFVGPAAVKGAHGFIPTARRMHTGLILSGAGIRAGVELPLVQQIDIAPTAARLLGLQFRDAEGVSLIH